MNNGYFLHSNQLSHTTCVLTCMYQYISGLDDRPREGGNISDSFTLHRGCRQGDPLSPYIFILCAEILAIQIRNNNEIQGIKVRSKEYKLTLYEDDSTLLLNGSERSLKVSLEILESFSKISGLHINYSKTEVIWIGSKSGSAEILCHNYNLEWGKTKFRLLGLNFNVNLDCMPKENFDCRLITIKNVLKNWDKRNLTPIGKIVVLKCCYFWFHFEVKFLTRFWRLFGLSKICLI